MSSIGNKWKEVTTPIKSLIIFVFASITTLSPAWYAVSTYMDRIAVLEKSNETISYIIREEMDEHKKGNSEGIHFSLWETNRGKFYYYDEIDKCFYGVQENVVASTWGYIANDNHFWNCGERKVDEK